MRIGGGKEGMFGHGGQPPHEPQSASAPTSRALTVVAAPAPRDAPPLARGDAAFLAHLIATKAQAPQTRARRRAEPADAIAVYRAAEALGRWGAVAKPRHSTTPRSRLP